MDIVQRIRELYPTLTRKQKSIADCLLESPEDMCYITLAQLSQRTSATELTLLRFCRKVGCDSFLELKNAFREYTQEMVKTLSATDYFIPDATIVNAEGKADLLREICREEAEASRSFFTSVDLLSIIACAEEIRRGRRVFLCAHDISRVLALFLEARLKLLYVQAQFVDLTSLSQTQEMLQQVMEGDVVIFVTFPKYYYPLASVAKNAASRGAVIVTISDSVSAPSAQYSRHLLLCRTATRVFYNSLTLPMALLNLLLSYLVIDMGPDYMKGDLKTEK